MPGSCIGTKDASLAHARTYAYVKEVALVLAVGVEVIVVVDPVRIDRPERQE